MDWSTDISPKLITWLGQGLGAIGLLLLMGKTFRILVITPFRWIAAKTRSVFVDKLIHQAEADLGLPHEVVVEQPAEEEK